MGRGSSKVGARASNRNQVITDNQGRSVTVVNADQIPSDRVLWPSGAFAPTGANNEYYAVFAKINGSSVDPNSLVGVKVPLSDFTAIKGIAGWQSWTSSKAADTYIKKYDKPGASNLTKSRVARAKAFSTTMKKFGL